MLLSNRMAAILNQAWLQSKVKKVNPKYYSARGNAIVPNTLGNRCRKLKYYNFRQRLPKISNYSRIFWAGNVKAIVSQPMKRGQCAVVQGHFILHKSMYVL